MVSNISMQGGYGNQNYGMGQQQYSQSYEHQRQLGSVMQNLKDKYGCGDCFESGPYFVHYEIPVQEIPLKVLYPNFFSRIGHFFNNQK